jgi:uncharacterized protein RhaS with RHS repeats
VPKKRSLYGGVCIGIPYHRYYDPTTGKYITPDPIGLVGGINIFAYSESNPVNWFDPDGLLKFNAEYIVKLAASVKARIGPAKLEGSVDLGSQHTPIFGPEYVTQSVKVKADLLLVELGLGAEREGIGKTSPLLGSFF